MTIFSSNQVGPSSMTQKAIKRQPKADQLTDILVDCYEPMSDFFVDESRKKLMLMAMAKLSMRMRADFLVIAQLQFLVLIILWNIKHLL